MSDLSEPPSILSRQTNFLQLYLYACGKSEVPPIFHYWSCLSMLAGVVEDRMWCEIVKDSPLKPLLYIFLVGPGSLGKGIAINSVMNLFLKAGLDVQYYPGQTTKQNLIDRLGQGTRMEHAENTLNNPKLWLIMDELGSDLPKGPMTDEFIKFMTKLYTSGPVVATGTRTRGDVFIVQPCVNWLVGTTRAWLVDSFTRETIYSGATARIAFIFANYRTDERYFEPVYPWDRDIVMEHLVVRLQMIRRFVYGGFVFTQPAKEFIVNWYNDGKMPEDDALHPTFGRRKEAVLKVAMLLAVADGVGTTLGPELILQRKHIEQAVQVNGFTLNSMQILVEKASETEEVGHVLTVAKIVRRFGKIDHSKLLRKLQKKGINSGRMKIALEDLMEQKKVERQATNTGGSVYLWLDGGG